MEDVEGWKVGRLMVEMLKVEGDQGIWSQCNKDWIYLAFTSFST